MSVIKSAFNFSAIKYAFAEYHKRVTAFLEEKDYVDHTLERVVIKSRAKGFGLRIDVFLDKLGNFARPEHVRNVQQKLADNQQELIRLQGLSKTVLKGYDVVRYEFVDEPQLHAVGKVMELPAASGGSAVSTMPSAAGNGDGLTRRVRRVCMHLQKIDSYLAARKAAGDSSLQARLKSFLLIGSSLLNRHVCATREQLILL